jgi:hypothetical protein
VPKNLLPKISKKRVVQKMKGEIKKEGVAKYHPFFLLGKYGK